MKMARGLWIVFSYVWLEGFTILVYNIVAYPAEARDEIKSITLDGNP